jgi:hypothetical protein
LRSGVLVLSAYATKMGRSLLLAISRRWIIHALKHLSKRAEEIVNPHWRIFAYTLHLNDPMFCAPSGVDVDAGIVAPPDLGHPSISGQPLGHVTL